MRSRTDECPVALTLLTSCVLKACPDFGRFLAAHLLGGKQPTCLSGDEDIAKLEMKVHCRDGVGWLKSASHEGKYT